MHGETVKLCIAFNLVSQILHFHRTLFFLRNEIKLM